jgi:hypothetical protein
MDKQSRRQLVRDFKERKAPVGVFAVRCAGSGETWVGSSKNLEAQERSLWMGLRWGQSFHKAMQAAWTAHGEASMNFEVLEAIDEPDLTPMGLADLLKARERHWIAALGAKKALG